jgi:hypothetical protein
METTGLTLGGLQCGRGFEEPGVVQQFPGERPDGLLPHVLGGDGQTRSQSGDAAGH